MPRHVDPEKRRRDIIRAASKLLLAQGLKGVTFASVAAELGGSTTVVTHYYSTVSELIDDVAARAVQAWQDDVDEIMAEHPEGPEAQLRAVLFEWLTPIVGENLDQERVRFILLGGRSFGDDTQRLLDSWEAGMRDLFRRCVRPLVPEERVEAVADVLRVAYNGLALSTAEHPDYWTADRQTAVFETVVASLGLLTTSKATK